MPNDKPLVLVLGATGKTGGSIVNGLLASGNFRVAAATRPSSLSKPETEKLRAAGVEIRLGDITDKMDDLKKLLDGVDIVISAVIAWLINAQKDILRAAKEVGVKRVVPCDFGTPGAKGVRELHDMKLAVREFVQELGVPYTFIDVGWWMQHFLPIPMSKPALQVFKEASWKVVKDINAPVLLTNLDHIGTYVARIVADPRTLNQAVIVWEDEVRQHEAHEIGERASGEEEELKSRRIYVEMDEFVKMAAVGKELVKKDPTSFEAHVVRSRNQYLHSMFVLQENTLENAKRLGYLDVQELYPDIEPLTLEQYAREFYAAINNA